MGEDALLEHQGGEPKILIVRRVGGRGQVVGEERSGGRVAEDGS